jgi:hypothetical protein
VISINPKSAKRDAIYEVKLLDRNGKETAGYPKHFTQKAMNADGGISVEIPVDNQWRDRITKELLSKDSFLMGVSLVIRESDEEK